MREHFIQSGRVRHQATRCGNDDFWVNLDGLFQGPTLVATVGIGAIEIVNFRNAAACKLFYLTAQFNEGITQVLGQALPKRGLTCPTQTNERNAIGPRCLLRGAKQH
jgi:hypothetical protein